MKCPYCSGVLSRVVDTRPVGDGIRRRRECRECGRRFTTYEQVMPSLVVIKSDGRREPYDRQKLMTGIQIACAKRPISTAALEGLVDTVEDRVFHLGKAEVKSSVIGEMVLEGLKALDQVAYIRFATVYLALEDLNAVRAEIDRLLASSTM